MVSKYQSRNKIIVFPRIWTGTDPPLVLHDRLQLPHTIDRANLELAQHQRIPQLAKNHMTVISVSFPIDDVADAAERVTTFVQKPSDIADHIEDSVAFDVGLQDATFGELPETSNFRQDRSSDSSNLEVCHVIAIRARQMRKHPSQLVGKGL